MNKDNLPFIVSILALAFILTLSFSNTGEFLAKSGGKTTNYNLPSNVNPGVTTYNKPTPISSPDNIGAQLEDIKKPLPPLEEPCSITDYDNDGINDCIDNCPNNYNPGQQDVNGDGEGDMCDDTDNDGLTDHFELLGGSHPSGIYQHQLYCIDYLNDDSDNDGLIDGLEYGDDFYLRYPGYSNVKSTFYDIKEKAVEEELYNRKQYLANQHGSNLPLIPGTIDDYYLLRPYSNPCIVDTDRDGLNDLYEYNTGTFAGHTDSDADGLVDGYSYVTSYGQNIYGELSYGTDPLDSDTDGDNIPDGVEVTWEVIYSQNKFDPTKSDTDSNGINDGDEDYDNDGLTNSEEFNPYPKDNSYVSNNLHRFDASSAGTPGYSANSDLCSPFSKDTDGDGISDSTELKYSLTKHTWMGVNTLDYDLLVNSGIFSQPFKFRTRCNSADSDGDGLTDDEEACYYENLNGIRCDPNSTSVHDYPEYTVPNSQSYGSYMITNSGTDTSPIERDSDNDGYYSGVGTKFLCHDDDDKYPLDSTQC